MLSSIHPLGERSRNNPWCLTVGAYLVGSTVGGATVGLCLGALGWLVFSGVSASIALLILAVCCVLAVAVELSGTPLPSLARQVNERWLDEYRGWVYGLGFGFQLGLGAATYITTAAVYAAAIAAILTASPLQGLAVGICFGAVRALPLVAGVRLTTPGSIRGMHALLQRYRDFFAWLSRGVLVAASSIGAVVALA